MVPVRVPPGSPAFNASVVGALPEASLSSAVAAEGGGVAAGAGAAACASAAVLSESTIANRQKHEQARTIRLIIVCSIVIF